METSRQKNILALRHVIVEGMGTMGPFLSNHGYDIHYVEVCHDTLDAHDPISPDLVVVLGGPISVYEEKTYPFITDELRFLERRIAADLPTLGICLGAQFIAKALGARVYPGQSKEIGWFPIALSELGARHPVLEFTKESSVVPHWHGDTFDLPTSAERLASSAMCENQAFTLGENVLALQFHPEVDNTSMAQWTTAYALELALSKTVTVAKLIADTKRSAHSLENRTTAFLSRWTKTFNAPILE